MNIRIFTSVCNLHFDSDESKVWLENDIEIQNFQEKVQAYVREKSEAKVTWLQSIGSASAFGFGALSVPFIQLTAIVTW